MASTTNGHHTRASRKGLASRNQQSYPSWQSTRLSPRFIVYYSESSRETPNLVIDFAPNKDEEALILDKLELDMLPVRENVI